MVELIAKNVNFTHVGASVINFVVIWHHGNSFQFFSQIENTSQRTEDNRVANCSHRKKLTFGLS